MQSFLQGENFDEQIGPTVEELVADEELDIIPYVDWETKPEPEKAVAEPVSLVLIFQHFVRHIALKTACVNGLIASSTKSCASCEKDSFPFRAFHVFISDSR